MRRLLLFLLLAGALAAVPVKPKASRATKPAAKTHNPRVVPASTRSRSPAARTRTAHGRAKKVHVAPAPSYQLHPDPERYTQIQQALADRGYFKGTVNGQWSDDSVEAMRRFQADQKIDNDGKIDALSLTALGLGPKHDGSTASTVPLSAAAPPPTPAVPDPDPEYSPAPPDPEL